MLAAVGGHTATVRSLLHAKADLNLQNKVRLERCLRFFVRLVV
jgi:hypothetical protein